MRIAYILKLNSLKKFHPEVDTKKVRTYEQLLQYQNTGGGVGGVSVGGIPGGYTYNPPTRQGGSGSNGQGGGGGGSGGGRGQWRGREGGREGQQRGRGGSRPGVYGPTGLISSADFNNMSLDQQRLVLQMTQQRDELQRRQQVFQTKNLRLPLPSSTSSDGAGVPQAGPPRGQQFTVDPFRLYSKVRMCLFFYFI